MSDQFNELLKSFEKAIKNKEAGSFGIDDVKTIHKAASGLFDGQAYLDDKQIERIRDMWVKLAEGRIDKGNAMKKLKGTSRAEAIQSVLMSIV